MAEEYEEFEEATPEEKLRIASHFILSAPNGHVDGVIADVKKLLGAGSLLTTSIIDKLLRQYNKSMCVFAPLADGRNLVCTDHNEVGDLFLDPSTKRLHRFNHRTRVWDEAEDAPLDESDTPHEALRADIEQRLSAYVAKFYVKDDECAYFARDLADGTIVVIISSKCVNLKAYWSGGWKSTYVLDVASGSMTSRIDINAHYYEEGNVQLNTLFEGDAHTDGTAGEVVDAITDFESGFQKRMEEMYRNMESESFKSMRRMLPITNQKMDWRPEAHSLVSSMATK